MTKAETTKRYILFIISLFFAALGVAFTKHGELGVSPISSVANVMSCKFSALSLGTWLIIWNCILIVGQIAILRKQFQPIQLLQVPLSFLFGWFTNFGMWLVSFIPASNESKSCMHDLDECREGQYPAPWGVSISMPCCLRRGY